MSYGHAERNLALIRQLEADAGQLLENLGPAGCGAAGLAADSTAGLAAATDAG